MGIRPHNEVQPGDKLHLSRVEATKMADFESAEILRVESWGLRVQLRES
jgi:hypothetical protein